MKKSFFALVCLSALALIGCGNDNNNQMYPPPGVGGFQGQIQPPQGYCAPEVVDAYNNFAYRCNNMNSDFNVQTCKFAARGFLQIYPNMSCLALVANGQTGGYYNPQYNGNWQGQATLNITSEQMKYVLSMLDNQGWQRNYRPYPGGNCLSAQGNCAR
jgi:hypothetical protein